MNHINFYCYAHANAYGQTPEEFRQWCRDANLVIERKLIEEAGILVIACKAV